MKLCIVKVISILERIHISGSRESFPDSEEAVNLLIGSQVPHTVNCLDRDLSTVLVDYILQLTQIWGGKGVAYFVLHDVPPYFHLDRFD